MSQGGRARSIVRTLFGVTLTCVGLIAFAKTTFTLAAHDYLGAILFGTLSLAFVGAGSELLRPEIGE
jgi:hypothetical protein